MMADFTAFLMIMTVTAVIYYLIPKERPGIRQWLIIAASILFLWSLAPASVAAAIAIAALTLLYARYGSLSGQASRLAWVVTVTIIAILLGARLGDLPYGPLLGLSYITVKSIGAIWQIRRNPAAYQSLSISDILSLLLFFPIFTAGPIERLETFKTEKFSAPLSAENLMVGVYRILLGAIKVALLSEEFLVPLASALRAQMFESSAVAYLYVLLRFLTLYVNFSGYTDMAVGCGRILGLRIMENFNAPLLASSIQDFWKRWHMSLGRFMTDFIFRPLLFRTKGRPEPAIFLTFLIVGLWHDLSWNYLIWGIGHGALMVAGLTWQRRSVLQPDGMGPLARGSWRVAGTILTISAVAYLSAFANEKDIGSALALTKALIGV